MRAQGVSKREPAVAAILRSWRSLTGGRRVPDAERGTLVACSGGPDSVGLALALHTAGGLAGLAHVVHDLRPAPQALADRDAVRELAGLLGVVFIERKVAVRAAGYEDRRGGLEAAARRLRYAALAKMAVERGVGYVATGHHADDQLETIVMRLARGSGPRGLGGILPRRRLTPGVTLIRPCLTEGRAKLAALCTLAGVTPRIDSSNTDAAFTRNAVRARVTPELMRLFPGAADRAEEFAARMRAIDRAIASAAEALVLRAREHGGGEDLCRKALGAAERAVLHAALRVEAIAAGSGAGADRISWRAGERVVEAILDGEGGEREFRLGHAVVVVSRELVRIRRRS